MSTKLAWTRLNTDQWLFKLSDLPPMEVNVYVKLRIRMLHTREPLLNDSRVLSHFTCCTVKRFEKALHYLFRSGHIISLEDGRLWSSDVEEELNNSNENINKFSERAQKAAQAKWAKHHKKKQLAMIKMLSMMLTIRLRMLSMLQAMLMQCLMMPLT